jgi:hypothetical protein
MTRTEKIQLLEAYRAGTLPAELLEQIPGMIIVFEETDGFFRFQNSPPLFGMPENMTPADYANFKEKLNTYCEARQKMGLPEPILVCFEEKKTY